MAHRARIFKGIWFWPALSALMLLGMVAEAQTRITRADAEPHLARCKAAIESIPLTILGPSGAYWTGAETNVPLSATQLLRPNQILSRTYVRQGDPLMVSLLIVDCRDARDLQGHYPPNCYPAQGLKLIGQIPRTWRLSDGLEVPGMEYHFASEGHLEDPTVVYNFFVTPLVPGLTVSHPELNGVICRDIDSVYTSGEDYQRRYFGAAEFQLMARSRMTGQQLDHALIDLLSPNQNVIRTLMNRAPGGKSL